MWHALYGKCTSRYSVHLIYLQVEFILQLKVRNRSLLWKPDFPGGIRVKTQFSGFGELRGQRKQDWNLGPKLAENSSKTLLWCPLLFSLSLSLASMDLPVENIFYFLEESEATLLQCSLVNRAFHALSITFLYRQIEINSTRNVFIPTENSVRTLISLAKTSTNLNNRDFTANFLRLVSRNMRFMFELSRQPVRLSCPRTANEPILMLSKVS